MLKHAGLIRFQNIDLLRLLVGGVIDLSTLFATLMAEAIAIAFTCAELSFASLSSNSKASSPLDIS